MPPADEQLRPGLQGSRPLRSRPQRSWRRRWIPRFLVATMTLLLVIIVMTEIVLRSTIPRQIVIAQVEKTLGLRVTAASLTTGWLGHTTLRDVQVSLPFADSAFTTVPVLRVTHTILPILLLTQSLDIDSIELERPVVTVTQDRFGRWNLQDVAAIVLKIGGQGQAQQNSKSSPLVLPAISLVDGTINITDNANRHATLTPLSVSGTVINSLVWKYDVHLDPPGGGHIALTGRVAPNDNFNHEINFDLSQLAALARPWLADFDPKAMLKGSWHGSVAEGGLSGRLLLQSLQYRTCAATEGDFIVHAKDGGVTVAPSSLTAQLAQNLQTRLRITGGSIHADSTSAKIDQLDVQALSGHIRVDGSLAFADLSASMIANWNDLTAARDVNTTGMFTASFRPEWPDRHAITARLTTSGAAAGAPYSADVQVTATGKTWDAADATITAPTLFLNCKTPLRLDGLAAHLTSHAGEIDLNDLTLGSSATLAGAGAIKFDPGRPGTDHHDWWIHLLGQQIALPAIPTTSIHDQTVAFEFNASGDQKQVILKNTWGTIGQVIATASGLYSFENPRPVDLNITVADGTALTTPTITPATFTPATAPTSLPTATTAPALVQGHLRGDLELTGIAYPLDLSLNGQLHARGLIVGDRRLQDVDAKCTGVADHEHVEFDTEELKLLGGQWKLHAQAPGHNHVPQATLTFRDLDLASVGNLLNQPGVTGTAAGAIETDFDEFKLDKIHVDGHFSANAVHARQLQIDQAVGTISLRQSELAVTPILLTRAKGHAEASVRLNIAHPASITTKFNATDWPLDIAAAHADLSARTDQLLIDAATQSVTGRLNFSTDAAYQSQPVASAKGSINLAGQTAMLDTFDAAALGGTASGTASFALNSPMASRGAFTWQGINLNALSPYEERLRDGSGTFSGKAVLAPATDARSLAPLLLSIDAVGTNTHLGPVVFSDIHLPISLDTQRAVIDGGRIGVADGSIDLFARLSLHVDNTLSAQMNATLKELDLDQLINEVEMSSTAPAATSAATPTTHNQKSAYPGRLNGQIEVVGDPRKIRSLFGSATLALHDSDLGNFGPFAALYNTMHLGGGPAQPTGTGEVQARYDNDNFIISSLHYFNRGTYAYGIAEVDNVSKYPNSGISGTLTGTFRPLSNIKLPFFADADKIFSVLQSNLTSIVVDGTIRKPTYTPQSAAELSSAMRNFLVGDTKSK